MKKVTIKYVATLLNKDPAWIRAGIIEGWLPIGIATRKGKKIDSLDDISSKKGRINYTIFPEQLQKLCGGSYDR